MIPTSKATFRRTVAGLLLCLSLTACGTQTGNTAAKVSDADKQAIVLTANGVDFTAEQYAASYLYNLNRMDNILGMYGQKTSAQITDKEERDSFSENIAQLAKQQLVYLSACEAKMKENGLSYTDAEIDAEIKTLADQMGGDTGLDTYLKDIGLTRDQYREFAKLNVMIQKLREDFNAKNPNAAREAFDKDYLRAKHVLVKTVDDNNAELPNQDALKAKAEDIAKRAKAGEDFDTLIKTYNEDPGMESNPDGYVFTDGEMVPEFYEGTKALANDAVSDPVKTSYGWHIIKRLPLRDADFESKKAMIEEKAFSDLAQTWQDTSKAEEKEGLSKVNLDTVSGYLA